MTLAQVLSQVSKSFRWVQSFGVLTALKEERSGGFTGEGANWNKEAESSCQLDSFLFIIRPITVVRVQLKAANSEVLILAHKEDKDK